MKNKWFLAFAFGAMLSVGAPTVGWAQGSASSGSNDGRSPASSVPANGNAKRDVGPNGAAGSSGWLPENSLSQRSAADPVTREGDVPNQIATLAPYAAVLALLLVGALYWFVFRKPTSPEGEAASKGQVQ